MKNLIERLRQHSQDLVAYKMGSEFADAVVEAADVIEKLMAENEYLQNIIKDQTRQYWKTVDEIDKLTAENAQLLRGGEDYRHLAEEVADATIMLEQIRLMFNINDCVCNFMDEKIKRLDDRAKGSRKNAKSD